MNRRVLYTALLLHDIGKGLPRDHSEAGAEIAAALCPRLGLPEDEVETVVWLVENHLLMSDVAQKRDLADERTIRDFARVVKSPARLKLLCVLTVCDIRGVGQGVWKQLEGSAAAPGLCRDAELSDRRRPGAKPPRAHRRGAGRVGRPAQGLAQGHHCSRARPPLSRLLAGPRHRHAGRLCRADPRGEAGRAAGPHRPRRSPRRHPRLLRHARPPGPVLAAGRRAGARGRERRGCAHLHHLGRHRDAGLLDPGSRGQAVRGRAPGSACAT